MAKILAIETATRVCSVALIDGGAVTGESGLNIPHVHVERLVILINELLENLHASYAEIDAIAVSNGPGSFTGLRIGLSVAKGIAFALDRKIIAVPTLDALALSLSYLESGRMVVPILHARGEEFYYAPYVITDSGAQRQRAYAIAEAEKIADEFAEETVFIGEGVAAFSKTDAARRKFGQGSMKDVPASAREVALLADDRFKKGEFADLSSLVPLYIKDFIAIKGNPLNKLSRPMPGSRLKSGLEES